MSQSPTKETLSKEAEQKIASTLADVADLVNKGTKPNDAIVKAASERSIPAGHIGLMVNAFNIGRSEAQRKSSSDLFEKVSEFDLADTPEILDRMFPATVKSAGVLAEEIIVSSEYSLTPRALLNRAAYEKKARQAVINWKIVETPAPLPRDPATAVKKAYAAVVNVRRQYEELRRTTQEFHDQTFDLMKKFATELRTPGAPSTAEVQANCRVHGDLGVQIFDRVLHDNPILTKLAGHDPGLRVVNWDKPPYVTFSALVKAAGSFLLAKDAFDKFAAQAAEKERAASGPFVEATREGGSVLGQSYKLASMFAGLMGTALGSSLSKQMGSTAAKPTTVLQQGMKNTLNDPQQESGIRNIQTESMLSDLMANDEVISGYDPNEVIGHFNEISQLSPRATNQSGLMRALLRKRLQQGALDPYEVDLLLKIENSLKTRDAPPSGVLAHGPAGVM